MKTDIPALIKTKPELFDSQDCRPAGGKDQFWAGFHDQSNEHLPDHLKQALAAAKAKRESQPAQS